MEHEEHRDSESNVEVTEVMRAIDDKNLKKELEVCKHFLMECMKQNGTQGVFIFLWTLWTRNFCPQS